MLSSITARSAMMLLFVPAVSCPTVTTANSPGAISGRRSPAVGRRSSRPARRVDGELGHRAVAAAAMDGDAHARRRWTGTGRRVCRRCPPAAEGRVGDRRPSGLGTRLASPPLTIPAAPRPSSSAGWNSGMNVPRQAERFAESRRAAPIRLATCTSWPQACATGTPCRPRLSARPYWRRAARSPPSSAARPCPRA